MKTSRSSGRSSERKVNWMMWPLAGAFLFITTAIYAIEVNEPAGAQHGYPALYDLDGNKLADGEFRQWIEDARLHVVITYRFDNGRRCEEKSVFRQHPELIQEKWSWQ